MKTTPNPIETPRKHKRPVVKKTPKTEEEDLNYCGVGIGLEKLLQEDFTSSKIAGAFGEMEYNSDGLGILFTEKKPNYKPLLKYIATVVTLTLISMLYCSYEIYLATQDVEISA